MDHEMADLAGRELGEADATPVYAKSRSPNVTSPPHVKCVPSETASGSRSLLSQMDVDGDKLDIE